MSLFYRKAMDALYLLCVVIAGTALVLISAVIPWAVYTRYVMNRAASCPAPTGAAYSAPVFGGIANDRAIDILVLLGCLCLLFAIGMPIAYSLWLAAIAGALWIGVPLEAVMLKISDGVSKVAMLTIPFFVLAGAIMSAGGMATRLVAFANVLVVVVRVRCGLSAVTIICTTFLSGLSGHTTADTACLRAV